ncbi:MAG TPA: hypothetical protein DCS28_00405 [Candidatus Moranbacteria bacterium]|nr:hypothetical protein [Candidatus Moranbacteria bacterium]HAT74492.1 hypothetical protein [Candidatus Moranbacteria bacterium]
MLSFFEGIIAALGALILELTLPFFGLPAGNTSLIFLFSAVLIEEIIKYAFVYNNYLKLESKEKIIRNSLLIGFGFAAAEIFLKQLSFEKTTALLILGVFLIHVFTTSLAGFFLSRKYKQLFFLSVLIICFNIFLHFAYNFLILSYL